MILHRLNSLAFPLVIAFMVTLLTGTVTSVFAVSAATTAAVKINTGISPVEITVGDLATYTVTVTHAENIKIEPPALANDFTGFELVDQGASPLKNTDGKIEQQFWYRLRGDLVGAHTLTGPTIKFENQELNAVGQKDSGETVAPDTKATIRSVLYLEGEPRDIRNIKPIVGAAWPWKKYLPPALAFIALACLIGYAANWWVKRNRIKPAVYTPPALPADEMALRELDRLYEKRYHENKQIRELCFEFSEIFRRYLGQRYLIPALDWTTEEIGRTLNHRHDLPLKQREDALRILTNTDLVKFAKRQVDSDTAIHLMNSARAFIQQTSKPEAQKNISGQETAANES